MFVLHFCCHFHATPLSFLVLFVSSECSGSSYFSCCFSRDKRFMLINNVYSHIHIQWNSLLKTMRNNMRKQCKKEKWESFFCQLIWAMPKAEKIIRTMTPGAVFIWNWSGKILLHSLPFRTFKQNVSKRKEKRTKQLKAIKLVDFGGECNDKVLSLSLKPNATDVHECQTTTTTKNARRR